MSIGRSRRELLTSGAAGSATFALTGLGGVRCRRRMSMTPVIGGIGRHVHCEPGALVCSPFEGTSHATASRGPSWTASSMRCRPAAKEQGYQVTLFWEAARQCGTRPWTSPDRHRGATGGVRRWERRAVALGGDAPAETGLDRTGPDSAASDSRVTIGAPAVTCSTWLRQMSRPSAIQSGETDDSPSERPWFTGPPETPCGSFATRIRRQPTGSSDDYSARLEVSRS